MEDDKKLSITTVMSILIWTLFTVSLFLYFTHQVYNNPNSFKEVVTLRFYSHPIQ